MYTAEDNMPPHLLAAAFRAGYELAWPRREALEAISWFARQGLAVEGVEVWIPAGSGPEIPTPFIYTWTVQPGTEEEPWPAFVVRAEEEATAYIRDFRWDEGDRAYRGREPFFNLAVAESFK